MGRKKILVDIYLAANLGDDMFLDHLSNSFPHVDFVPFHPGNNYISFFRNYPNIHQFTYTIFDKILARFGKSKLTNYEALSKEYDGFLFLGGGIFRQEYYWPELFKYRAEIVDSFNSKNKKVFFSGCNFGPYTSQDFLHAHSKLFKNAEKIIFRDQKSYHLFSNHSNVCYAPDVLWSYDLPVVKSQEKVLGISVIDPRHKEQYKETYQDYIQANRKVCEKYINEGYKITLFSFCEKEGDLEISKEIAKNLPGIKIENYTDDINSYLKRIGKCSHFIAARFHAVIIAMKFGIPVIPVIYGDKTENLLIDLNFEKSFVYLDAMNKLENASFLTISSEIKDALYAKSKIHFNLKF